MQHQINSSKKLQEKVAKKTTLVFAYNKGLLEHLQRGVDGVASSARNTPTYQPQEHQS
jgi:hypothetical protein